MFLFIQSATVLSENHHCQIRIAPVWILQSYLYEIAERIIVDQNIWSTQTFSSMADSHSCKHKIKIKLAGNLHFWKSQPWLFGQKLQIRASLWFVWATDRASNKKGMCVCNIIVYPSDSTTHSFPTFVTPSYTDFQFFPILSARWTTLFEYVVRNEE